MVKINEFHDTDINVPYNIADDLHVYMKNDPIFYRRNVFPVLSKLSDLHKANKKYDVRQSFMPLVDKAATSYCEKFKIPYPVDKIITQEDKDEIIERMCEEELPLIQKGDY